MSDTVFALRNLMLNIMRVDDTTLGPTADTARFRGELTQDSAAAYAWLDAQLKPLGLQPLFRNEEGRHVVYVQRRPPAPPASNPWINVVLFGLTLLSMAFVGATYGYTGETLPETPSAWLAFFAEGIPFMLAMMGILLAHELGHYFAARYHKMAVTLPYFIPLPFSIIGTMGAVIRLKEPPVNKRVLLDVGVAGPLAGLVVAVPILLYGLFTSPLTTLPMPADLPPGQTLSLEGNSLIYILAKLLAFGRFLPLPATFELPPVLHMAFFYLTGWPKPYGGTDVLLNDLAWAGWAGLLITGLNLIPAGQLDGGHALYVLIGRHARLAVTVIVGALVVLGFLWNGWFLWAALIFFLGRQHAEPLDQITEAGPGRKALAVLALALFVALFTPIPLS